MRGLEAVNMGPFSVVVGESKCNDLLNKSGNKNYVRMPSFRRKEKRKIISLKSTLPIRLFGVLLWKLASVDGVDDNLTNRSSTAAVMAPREKVEKAGYAPQSLLPVQKSQLDLAPRNDSSGESTRRVSWVYYI